MEGAVLQFGPGATELCLEHLATEPWYARAARDWRVCLVVGPGVPAASRLRMYN